MSHEASVMQGYMRDAHRLLFVDDAGNEDTRVRRVTVSKVDDRARIDPRPSDSLSRRRRDPEIAFLLPARVQGRLTFARMNNETDKNNHFLFKHDVLFIVHSDWSDMSDQSFGVLIFCFNLEMQKEGNEEINVRGRMNG